MGNRWRLRAGVGGRGKVGGVGVGRVDGVAHR